MKLDVYINYRGTCEEAFKFYEQHLNGKLTFITKHGANVRPEWSSEWKDKVLHAQIQIGNTTVMGADMPQAEPMRSAYLSLTVETEVEAERVYAVLTEGGEIFMKMDKTHFANRFAMCRDRFGTSWMILQQPM